MSAGIHESVLTRKTSRPVILRAPNMTFTKAGYHRLRTHHTPYISLNNQGFSTHSDINMSGSENIYRVPSACCGPTLSVCHSPLIALGRSRTSSSVLLSGYVIRDGPGTESLESRLGVARFQSISLSYPTDVYDRSAKVSRAGSTQTESVIPQSSTIFPMNASAEKPVESVLAQLNRSEDRDNRTFGKRVEDDDHEGMLFVIRKKARDLWDN